MKTMLFVIMISGILLGVQALDCYQCTEIASDSSSDQAKKTLESLISGALCDGATSSACDKGMDECAANIVSFKVEADSRTLAVSMVTKMCSSTAADKSADCDAAKSKLGRFKDVQCETETCSTDGCNTQTAFVPGMGNTAPAPGLSISLLLFASIAIAMFN